MADKEKPEHVRKYCGDCAYFAVNSEDLSQGDCRFEPPKTTPLSLKDGGFKVMSYWPTVKRVNKACSKHYRSLDD